MVGRSVASVLFAAALGIAPRLAAAEPCGSVTTAGCCDGSTLKCAFVGDPDVAAREVS